jgi:hypothetical protein
MSWPFTDSTDYGVASDDTGTTSDAVRVSLTPGSPKRNADTPAGQRPTRGCGTTWAGPSRTDPTLWMVHWAPDRTMGCEHCGPWVRQQKAAAYLAKIGTTPLYKRVVDAAGWATAARRLRRGEVDYLQVPTPDGHRAVLASSGPGELVADNQAEVEALIAAYPAGCGMNISASRTWQPTAVRVGQDQDQVDGFDFRYIVRAGLEHAKQVASELGLYVADVPGRGGDAFLLRQPDDPLTWRRFKRWAGLEEPGRRRPGRRRRREAA